MSIHTLCSHVICLKKYGLIRNEFCRPTILCGAASGRFPRGLCQPNQLAYPVDQLQQSRDCFHLRLGNHSLVSLFLLWVFKLHLPKSNYLCPRLGLLLCNENQLGEEKVYFTTQVTVHHPGKPGQGLKVQTWGQELKQIMDKHQLLACFPCFDQLSFLHKTGPPTWSPPHQSLMKKMSLRHAYQLILWRQLLS